jgi:serine/threonine-protein kinase HipA
MYLSARSLMQARPNQQYTYVDIANAIRENGSQVSNDLEELWRRMVFNILINNVDDHLNNHGFLHQANNQWRLAPAFDLNPFPDKQRLLKTWISEESGDNSSIADAVASAALFELSEKTSSKILQEVKGAVSGWKKIANQIGMSSQDIKNYEPAFEHPEY